MKTLAGQLVLALLLAAAGLAVRQAALVETRLAAAESALATLDPDGADREYGGVQDALSLAGRLPLIGEELVADVRQERAMVSYWRGDYAAVPTAEADLAPDSVGADFVFIAGNAAYRNVRGKHVGQQGAQDLDPVLRIYTTLLKKSPGHIDAAYNYEYVVRLRNVLARMKPGDAPKGAASSEPAPPSVHGEKGDPPTSTPPDQFNVIVPLKPEERGDLLKAGTSGPRQRKG
ncbi:MAG: hypothetical protein AB7I25_11905 [Vicinamibacterales bacterium]